MGTGTIVDATIISAPPSTKNKDKSRDPDMHQTKKGNQWYFGMKAHIGVDSQTKVIHAVVATPANVHDSVCLPDLLHGEETRLWGDSAYQGQTEVIRKHAPKAKDLTNRRYRYVSCLQRQRWLGQGLRSNPIRELRMAACDAQRSPALGRAGSNVAPRQVLRARRIARGR